MHRSLIDFPHLRRKSLVMCRWSFVHELAQLINSAFADHAMRSDMAPHLRAATGKRVTVATSTLLRSSKTVARKGHPCKVRST
jgi:hypothetical protein